MNVLFLFVNKQKDECANLVCSQTKEHIHNIVCLLNEHFLFVHKLYYECALFVCSQTNFEWALFVLNELYYECALFVCEQTILWMCSFCLWTNYIMNVLFLFVNKLILWMCSFCLWHKFVHKQKEHIHNIVCSQTKRAHS